MVEWNTKVGYDLFDIALVTHAEAAQPIAKLHSSSWI